MQRQALELALYTFKYVDGVNAVTVLLPPSFDVSGPATGSPELKRTALFLRRGDVMRELEQPLIETLVPRTPRVGQTKDRDLSSILRISQPHIYSYSLTQTQDARFHVRPQAPSRLSAGKAGGRRAPRAGEGAARRARLVAAAGADRSRPRVRDAVVFPAALVPALRRARVHFGMLLRSASASDDLITHELCHVWQMQHRPVRMPLSYLVRGYWNNPYERQARAAAAARDTSTALTNWRCIAAAGPYP